MDNNGYYSFEENTLPHPSMSPFESQPNGTSGFGQVQDGSFTAKQNLGNDFFTGEGAFGSETRSNLYAFNENTLPQSAQNQIWQQPMSNNNYQEILQGQYTFDQSALAQPAVTNGFDFNTPTSNLPSSGSNALDFDSPSWGGSSSNDQQAFERPLSEFAAQDWLSAAAGQSALSGGKTRGWKPTPLTGSDVDAPFQVNESGSIAMHNHIQKEFISPIASPGIATNALTLSISHNHTNEPLTCSWSGCKKTTPFKTQKILQTHLENIHIYPLLCTQPGCTYRFPFPKKGDLDRHLASKHGIGRLFRCPQLKCSRRGRPFGRKDKLREHVRATGHGLNHCQYDHCKYKHSKGFLTREEVSEHEANDHGDYECRIGSCEASSSCFSEHELKRHLSLHNIRNQNRLFVGLLKPGQKTITLADVDNLGEEWFWRPLKVIETTCRGC